MSPDYYDTGILLKLYTVEPESPQVHRFVTKRNRPIPVSELHLSEAVSAFRLKQFRKECSPTQAADAIALLESDLRSRLLCVVDMDWTTIWASCRMLAQAEAGKCGARTLDTLHVACALSLHASLFVTSDKRQSMLARICGLRVANPAARR